MYLVRKQINLITLSVILLVLYTLFTFLNYHKHEDVNEQVIIVDKNRYDNYERYTVKKGRFKYHIYGYDDAYDIGDVIYIKGKIITYRSQSSSFGFNAKTYYLSYQIYGKIEIEEITYIKHKFHLNSIRDQLIEKIEVLEKSEYIRAFIFGEKIKDEQVTKTYDDFNILYLFTVSGMHVYVLFLGIKKIMFICNLDLKKQHVVIISFYMFIGFLNKFTFSIMRLLYIYLLKLMNKKYRLSIPHLDLIYITFLIILCMNIGYIYHQGFIMTFLILIALELLHPIMQRFNGYIQKLLMSSIVFLVIIPFYPNIYIFQLFLMPVLIIIVTFLLYPLSIMALISKNFNLIFSFVIDKFESLIKFLTSYQTYHYMPKFNIWITLIYYGLLGWIFMSKSYRMTFKRALCACMVIILSIIFQLNTYKDTITFLDVGQGDTTIIQSNGCQIVIDSFNGAYDYLKNHGFYNIDYLILTHSDEDHIKEANDILENINVKHLVLSKYDHNYPQYHKQALFVSAGQQLKCKDISIDILAPLTSYEKDNNNSIVMQFVFDHKIFLFTGDIEKEAEYDLIKTYQDKLKSDVIKVPHHGSITSSTKEFMNHVNPSYAVMSLKTPNAYGFPSSDVINRYLERSCVIYRTDVDGTITYHRRRRKEKWQLYLSI